jgi:hypothetical protein
MALARGSDALEFRRARQAANALSTERDYEIRFLKADGTVSLMFVTNCVSDEHARETAVRMMRPEFASFEVWRGQTCATKGP